MLIAIYCVLSSFVTLNLGSIKFTFEAFPVLVASLLLGPVDGLIVGGVGSFIYQILFSGYGMTATTLLWVLPHAISGLVVGIYAKHKGFILSRKQTCFICIISALLVTSFNTFAFYIDSKMYGYYSYTLVFGNIILKIIAGIILSIVYCGALPRLISFLSKEIN